MELYLQLPQVRLSVESTEAEATPLQERVDLWERLAEALVEAWQNLEGGG